jgi:hypothetical protein
VRFPIVVLYDQVSAVIEVIAFNLILGLIISDIVKVDAVSTVVTAFGCVDLYRCGILSGGGVTVVVVAVIGSNVFGSAVISLSTIVNMDCYLAETDGLFAGVVAFVGPDSLCAGDGGALHFNICIEWWHIAAGCWYRLGSGLVIERAFDAGSR